MKKENLPAPKLKFSFHLNVCKFIIESFLIQFFDIIHKTVLNRQNFFKCCQEHIRNEEDTFIQANRSLENWQKSSKKA
jgi:hypothetical protein